MFCFSWKNCSLWENEYFCRKYQPMPQISSFYGIIIFMNFTDHSPAHFHAWYGEYKVTVSIRDGVVTGKMPGRALRMILEWLELHREELIADWEKAQNGSPHMFLEINKAEYLGDYRIRLWFNNNEVRDVDLANSLKGEAFLPLLDKDYFKRFTIRFNTIEWDNGADFAPEYLYDIGAIA